MVPMSQSSPLVTCCLVKFDPCSFHHLRGCELGLGDIGIHSCNI